MKIEQQATVLLPVDLAASRRFFVDVLGFEVLMDLGWFASLRHPSTGHTLDLWQRDHGSVPRHASGSPAGFLLAFVVDDAAGAAARFTGAGVAIVEPMRDEPWGQRHFVASAPDGVLIDVVQRIAPSPAWLAEHGMGGAQPG